MKAGNNLVDGSMHTAVVARMAELVKWVERGHTLIVVGLTPRRYHWVGNGGALVEGAIEALPPFNKIKLTAKSGKSIRCAPQAAALLEPFTSAIGYEFILEGADLIPFLFVRPTQRTPGRPDIIAGMVQLGEGFVIFTPNISANTEEYRTALEQLPQLFRAQKSEFPTWIDNFRTKGEEATFAQMTVRRAELETLQTEIAALDVKIDEERQLKQLFVGTGPSFENAVAEALSELGLQVTKGPHPRADLLVTNGQRIAAVEAKGIEGSAKEEYVRQVMMWMPEVDAAIGATKPIDDDAVLEGYRQQLGVLDLRGRDESEDCKGILVLGTFRLIPPDQRTQPDFPENVKAVLVRREICALSGIQLFVLVVLARSDAELKARIQEALFNTRGVFELGRDWKSALKPVADGEA
jgi:hypothetical protein